MRDPRVESFFFCQKSHFYARRPRQYGNSCGNIKIHLKLPPYIDIYVSIYAHSRQQSYEAVRLLIPLLNAKVRRAVNTILGDITRGVNNNNDGHRRALSEPTSHTVPVQSIVCGCDRPFHQRWLLQNHSTREPQLVCLGDSPFLLPIFLLLFSAPDSNRPSVSCSRRGRLSIGHCKLVGEIFRKPTLNLVRS